MRRSEGSEQGVADLHEAFVDGIDEAKVLGLDAPKPGDDQLLDVLAFAFVEVGFAQCDDEFTQQCVDCEDGDAGEAVRTDCRLEVEGAGQGGPVRQELVRGAGGNPHGSQRRYDPAVVIDEEREKAGLRVDQLVSFVGVHTGPLTVVVCEHGSVDGLAWKRHSLSEYR